jgi:hypothetical protein
VNTLARTVVPLALALSPAAPAHAETAPIPTHVSGCSLVSVSDPARPNTVHAVVWSGPVAAAALPLSDVRANPVSITVTCTVHVFGTPPDPAIELSGSGTAVAYVEPRAVPVTADGVWDNVAVCTTARLTDANGETSTYYRSDDDFMWYPDSYPVHCDGGKCTALWENCDPTLALLFWAMDQGGVGLDDDWDAVCGALASRAPGIPGVVDIDPAGDTYVAGELVWDCSPYVPRGR